ncbi:MAG: hypothetical protein ACI9VO_001271 [Colwellia sp.]|jgi:hypothetical protein
MLGVTLFLSTKIYYAYIMPFILQLIYLDDYCWLNMCIILNIKINKVLRSVILIST